MNDKLILAIDTSCDDTAAAVIHGTTVLSNVIASQTELHRPYGGVFPTVAKQAHQENIERVVELALKRAGVGTDKLAKGRLAAVAVTQGPGLAPALEVGIIHAKNMAKTHKLPLIAVNHIEAHALSPLAQAKRRSGINLSLNNQRREIVFPVLSVVVSGGHTEFIVFDEIGTYTVVGKTLDDAAGECLDKIGRMLNLGYPAGPIIEHFAKQGNPNHFKFPLPLTQTHDYNLSFSGLKTYARNLIRDLGGVESLSRSDLYHFCASAQNAVFRHITYKLNKIIQDVSVREVWLGGGVAANQELRKMIKKTLSDFVKTERKKGKADYPNIRFRAPYTARLTMDNAAMIGVVAGFKLERGEVVKDAGELDRRPRWEIGEQ